MFDREPATYVSLRTAGLTCYTSNFFSCIADSKHWESTLFATGRIAFPGMEADKLQFFPVRSSFGEQAKQLDTHQRHFIMVDSDKVNGDRRCIVVAIFTPAYQWIGACFWPASTTRWELLDLVCRGKHWHVITVSASPNKKHRSAMETSFPCMSRPEILMTLPPL